jgi:hypothetical protein
MLGCYVVCLFTVMVLVWTLPIGGWLLVLALVLVSVATLAAGDHNR